MTRPRLLQLLVAIGGVAILAALLPSADYYHDDFDALLRAREPLGVEHNLRVLSVDLPFRLAVALGGGPALLLLGNLFALSALLAGLFVLLRSQGFGRTRVALTVALAACGPGWLDLVLWPSGFQQLLAMALVVGSLALFDLGVRRRHGTGRTGTPWLAWSAALACVGAGVFSKYPTAALAPALVVVWRQMVLPRDDRRHTLGFVAAASAAWLLPLALALWLGWMEFGEGKLGTGRLLANVGAAAARLLDPTLRLGLAAALLLALAPSAARRSLLRPLFRVRAWKDALGRGAPWLSLGGVALLPFLLNERYFAQYYLAPAWLFLSVPLAGGFVRLAHTTEDRHRAVTIAVFPIVAALLLPLQGVGRFCASDAPRHSAAWARAAAATLVDTPRPCRLLVESATPSDEEDEALARRLEDTDGGRALVWYAGWRSTPVVHVREGERPPPPPAICGGRADTVLSL